MIGVYIMGNNFKKYLKLCGLILLVIIPSFIINITLIRNLCAESSNERCGNAIDQLMLLIEEEKEDGNEAPEEAAVNLLALQGGMEVFVSKSTDFVVCASSMRNFVGKAISETGITVNSIAKYEKYCFSAKVANIKCYCTAVEASGYYVMVCEAKSVANRHIAPSAGADFVYLLMAMIFIALIVGGMTKQLSSEEDKANRDKMTGFYNRRVYDTLMAANPGVPKDEKFAYIAFDINGLKRVNDNLGHDAGDELIRGGAECIQKGFGNYGKLFRMGGDEFVAILSISPEELEDRKRHFEEVTASWVGKKVGGMAISAGYVTRSEFPDKTMREIEKTADERMYRAKDQYYKEYGIDRRKN